MENILMSEIFLCYDLVRDYNGMVMNLYQSTIFINYRV